MFQNYNQSSELSRSGDRERGGQSLLMPKATVKNKFNSFKKMSTMQTKKMSLANMQRKLSRGEMKIIMAGCDTSGCGGYLSICDSTRKCCESSWKCNTTTGTGACIKK